MKLWIAREKCGNLFLYNTKPYKDGEYWKSTGNYYLIDRHLFTEITFENSPQKVELKLKNKLSFEEMEELIDDLI